MDPRRAGWLALAVVFVGSLAVSAEPDLDLVSAERILKDANLAADGPALLAFFRMRTLSEVDQDRLGATVRRLGDDSFTVREKASGDLAAAGRAALPFLR